MGQIRVTVSVQLELTQKLASLVADLPITTSMNTFHLEVNGYTNKIYFNCMSLYSFRGKFVCFMNRPEGIVTCVKMESHKYLADVLH